MFLIYLIKHNVEKKFQTGFIFYVSVSHKCKNKTSFVSFRVMFSGGIKNYIQNKREIPLHNATKILQNFQEERKLICVDYLVCLMFNVLDVLNNM